MSEVTTPPPSNSPWDRNANEDLWVRTLRQIPTRIGRLAYLSRLRNPETDIYEHHGLIAVFGSEAAEQAIRASHLETLQGWLALDIHRQKNDIDEYIDGLPQSRRKTIASWTHTKPYLLFLPPQTSEAQRRLFTANTTLILKSLSDPENSPL